MAKRWIETGLFQDSWYSQLSTNSKLFFIYLITNCDHAGVIDLNIRLAEFLTGIEGLAKGIDRVLEEFGNRLIHLRDNYYFIPNFIKVQYKGELNENVKAQKSVINRLVEFDIDPKTLDFNKGLLRVKKGLDNPLIRVQDKDKDKDKDIEGVKGEILENCLDPETFLNQFKKFYPPQHGAYGPELEKSIAIVLRDQPESEIRRIIPEAMAYAECFRLSEPDNYPNCKYIKQACNWLREERWKDGWGAKLTELQRIAREEAEAEAKEQKKLEAAKAREEALKAKDEAVHDEVEEKIKRYGIDTAGKNPFQIGKEIRRAEKRATGIALSG